MSKYVHEVYTKQRDQAKLGLMTCKLIIILNFHVITIWTLAVDTARKIIFSFSRRPEKMVFPKKLRWNLIFLALSGKTIFLFSENMILPLDGKWKMIFLKKIHVLKKKIQIFWKDGLFKKYRAGHDISCTIWKGGIFYPKTWYFLPGRKSREGWPFSRNTRKHDIFYLICSMPPCENKTKTILSHKNTPKGDWHSRSTP